MNSRYQRGGDIYARLATEYGTSGAERIAAVDRDGGDISDALGELRNGPKLNDSTLSIFAEQIISDPLAAPLESANNQIAKAFGNVFKNPFVLLVVVLVVFYLLGGFEWAKRKVVNA